jgi:hypothetical protein
MTSETPPLKRVLDDTADASPASKIMPIAPVVYGGAQGQGMAPKPESASPFTSTEAPRDTEVSEREVPHIMEIDTELSVGMDLLQDAEKDQYQILDATTYMRRSEYVPTDDEPFSGAIVRELVDVDDMMSVPAGLLDYVNKYMFVSRMPQHTKSRNVYVYYRKTLTSPLKLYDMDNLLTTELNNKAVWSSNWPDGSVPKSPIAYLISVLDDSIQIVGEEFHVTDRPGGIIPIDDTTANVNLFKGFEAKVLPRSEFDYEKIRVYLEHARLVLCRAAKYNPETGEPERDENGHMVPDPAREVHYHSLISALASATRGIKVKFEINIAGPKGVGKTNWFSPIVDAIGTNYAWIFSNAKKHFSGNFDAHAGSRLLSVQDEGGIGADNEHRPEMRARITNDKTPVNAKGVDQTMKRNYELFIILQEDRSQMDLADRRAFYIEALDLLRPIVNLSKTHRRNRVQDTYHKRWQASIQEPGFHDHLLTYLYLIHDFGTFVPHTAPPLTAEHAKARETARPLINRWVYDFLHSPVDDDLIRYVNSLGAATVKERFMTATGPVDLPAKDVSRHFLLWCHIDKGGAPDEVPDTKRYRNHDELEAAFRVEMQASTWYSDCYLERGKRMEYAASAHSREHKKSGAWYRFDLSKAARDKPLTDPEDMCLEDAEDNT